MQHTVYLRLLNAIHFQVFNAQAYSGYATTILI